jgi:hypothetical protein
MKINRRKFVSTAGMFVASPVLLNRTAPIDPNIIPAVDPNRIPTGFPEIDNLINGGLKKGTITTICGYSKTRFIRSLALHANKTHSVAFTTNNNLQSMIGNYDIIFCNTLNNNDYKANYYNSYVLHYYRFVSIMAYDKNCAVVFYTNKIQMSLNYISSIIFKIEKSPSSTTLCKLLKNRCGTLETVEI